jgi:hypothetical protein
VIPILLPMQVCYSLRSISSACTTYSAASQFAQFFLRLMGVLLRYPYEVRDASEYFGDIQDVTITKDMLDLSKPIVEQKSGYFDPEKIEDHYESATGRTFFRRNKVAGGNAPLEQSRWESCLTLHVTRESKMTTLPLWTLVVGVFVLGIIIAYGIMRNRSRTRQERIISDEATKDLYRKENHSS